MKGILPWRPGLSTTGRLLARQRRAGIRRPSLSKSAKNSTGSPLAEASAFHITSGALCGARSISCCDVLFGAHSIGCSGVWCAARSISRCVVLCGAHSISRCGVLCDAHNTMLTVMVRSGVGKPR